MSEIPYGYCHCGCGQKTNIATCSNKRDKKIKGSPLLFIHGHNNKGIVARRGEESPSWRGGEITLDGRSYRYDTNRSTNKSREYSANSRLIVEEILGKTLPPKCVVHHIDENRTNDKPENFVVCEDRAYHKFIHIRTKALHESGNPNFRKCTFCKTWDSQSNLIHRKSNWYHQQCLKEYQKEYRNRKEVKERQQEYMKTYVRRRNVRQEGFVYGTNALTRT